MRADELEPQPRCSFVGKDSDGAIVRCARWEGHIDIDGQPDEHQSYADVVIDMMAVIAGIEIENMTPASALVARARAEAWYRRLVIRPVYDPSHIFDYYPDDGMITPKSWNDDSDV